MIKFEYTVSDGQRIIGRFEELSDAVIFIEGYLNRYYADPTISLTISRVEVEG